MTLAQLQRELARLGISYVSDRAGRVHFDNPRCRLPGAMLAAILRHRKALAKRAVKPIRNDIAPATWGMWAGAARDGGRPC